MKRAFYFLLLFFGCYQLQAQQIESFLQNLEDYQAQKPQEKLYLHLDKYAYTAGETIWFKAYSTIGIDNLFSNWSNIGYVELIDPAEQVIKSARIILVNGVGIGDLPLIDTLTEGSYRVRAYTQWMRNDDPHYFYDRTIPISNGRIDDVQTVTTSTLTDKGIRYDIRLTGLRGEPLSKTRVHYQLIQDGAVVSRKRTSSDEQGFVTIDVDEKHANALIKLRFDNFAKLPVNKVIKPVEATPTNSVSILPEGGKLLAGVVNNIAVKAINPKGLGVKTTVTIYSGDDALSVIETNALGMGSTMIFIPAETNVLRATAAFADGGSIAVDMPELHRTGYSILVNTLHKERILSQVNVSNDLINNEDIYFVVHHLGRIFLVSKQKASKNELVFSIQRNALPNGVLTVSILNSRFVPVIERAFFNYDASNRLPLTVSTDKPTYGTRDSVTVQIESGETQDSLRVAALSASVVHLSKVHEDYRTAPNILSSLLLSNDLRGFIEQPGHYFSGDEVDRREIDQLMLTQGWRSVAWDQLGQTFTPTFDREQAIKISGYTKKLGRRAAEPHATVQLVSPQNFMDFLDTVSNEDGYFEFDDVLFPDSVKFLISARTQKGKNNIDIEVNTIEPPAVGNNRNAPLEQNDVNSLLADQIKASKQYFAHLEAAGLMEKSIMIEEVVVRASTRKRAPDHSTNLNGPGNADQVLTAEDLELCSNLEICLSGRLLGVVWRDRMPYNTRGNVPMQVVLDGMFIDPEQISSINVSDIESIEVLRNTNYTTIYGMNGANGVIIITSKIGVSAARNYTPRGLLTIQPQGIAVAKSFYTPKYGVSDAGNAAQDLRTTIHWESGIVTDMEGKAHFGFFTSDEKGKYLMVLEGLDLQGRIARELVEIEVK